MKINFENSYSNTILKRGLEYYKNECVRNVNIKDNVVGAIVKGTNNYHVGIEIKNGRVIEDNCDCPYYLTNGECKHITAVLYYLTNEDLEDTEDNNLSSILDKINDLELKEFLIEIMENDENIYDLFRRKFINYFSKLSASAYKRKIYTAIRESGGRDGFIDYNEGWEYTRKMYEFTIEASNLVENGDYESAFTIVSIILDSIPETPIDGSNGETSEVAYECIEVLQNIIDKSQKTDNIIEKIFNYISSELKSHNLSNYGIELDDLIINFIRKDLFLEKCESALIEAIDDCNSSDKWYSYHKKYYLEYLEELYTRIGNKNKQRKLLKNNLTTIEVFKKYIELLIKEDDIKDVISFLKEYREKNKIHMQYITDKLLDIYTINNMDLEYKEELYKAFFEYDKYNFEKYIKIKELYNQKEWTKESKIIISDIEKNLPQTKNIMAKIFICENLTDRLYELVKDDYDIIAYEEHLLPKYRTELIEKNIKICKNKLKVASNRNDYRKIAAELMHIKKLDINKKYLTNFIEYIKTEYANRPALLDEISHIK